jgi:hypothetical protein
MLRSVVGAVAANMMLVQCNSDVPISLACSIGVGNRPDHGIIGTASLWGTSKAYLQAGGRYCLWSSGSMRYRTIGVEVGVLDPHPMQDDTNAARQRDHCPLRSTPTG